MSRTPEFRPLAARSAGWRSLEGEGLEHLTLSLAAGGIRADSVVIGAIEGKLFGVRYRIDCDAGWRVLAVDIATTDGRALALASDGAGHWRTADGTPLPDLDGCIDIDLQGSPFTNTLPIRRLDLAPEHGRVDLDMVYIPFDSFRPYRFAQRYTCLERGRLYRYENAEGSFEATITVDEDGLVADYPPLFTQVAA